MRCNCCDRVLSEQEIQYNPEIEAFEMCTTCVEIALDAAYSNGFQYDDDDEYEYIYIGEESMDDLVVATDLGLTSFVDPWSSEGWGGD